MKKVDYKIIGERLRKLRKYMGLTQEQVANILDVGRDAILRIEKGERKIDLDEIKNFSRLYCVSIDELTSENKNNYDGLIAYARTTNGLTERDKKEVESLIKSSEKMKKEKK